MRTAWLDVRHGVRLLGRSPGFAVVVVLTLALGIGANTAVFSVVREVLLKPLPVESPERLVAIWENDRLRRTRRERASVPDFQDFRAQAQSFEALAAWQEEDRTLTGSGEPERLVVARVSANYFRLLGVRPVEGRDFVAEEEQVGRDRVVVLSEGLWKRRFGGDTRVIGRTLVMDGEGFAVIGIMPERARLPFQGEDLWMPLAPAGRDVFRGVHNARVYGRLKPGVTVEQAQTEMTGIMSRLEQAYPADNAGRGALVMALGELAVENVRPALLVLQAAVGLVLLIGCVNVSNLLLARAAAREREMAVRESLGAGRWQIARQLLAENLVVAALGGALGVLTAFWGVDALRAAGARALPGLERAVVDARMLGFAAAITLGVWALFSLAPALRVRMGRMGQGLVVVETALAVILLIGAGLLIRSFERLLRVDPGFDPRGVLAMSVQLPPARYPTPRRWPYLEWPQVTEFQSRLLSEARAMPGVEAAALGYYTPVTAGWTTRVTIAGRPAPPPAQQDEAQFRVVSEGYFQTVRVAVRQGRVFEERDDERHPKVAIVNDNFARKYFGAGQAVGQRIGVYGVEREIVGVAGDEKFLGLGRDAPPAMYLPYQQNPMAGMTLLVKTSGDPVRLAPALEKTFRSIDPDLAVFDVASLERELAATLAGRRFTMGLTGAFAAVALPLAALGVGGVVGYSVSRRTREIGVRMAMGATPRAVERLVVGQGLRLVGAGAAAGMLAALGLTKLLESQLFGVGARDPLTFVLAPVALLVAALLATWTPARRAARLNPLEALRY